MSIILTRVCSSHKLGRLRSSKRDGYDVTQSITPWEVGTWYMNTDGRDRRWVGVEKHYLTVKFVSSFSLWYYTMTCKGDLSVGRVRRLFTATTFWTMQGFRSIMSLHLNSSVLNSARLGLCRAESSTHHYFWIILQEFDKGAQHSCWRRWLYWAVTPCPFFDEPNPATTGPESGRSGLAGRHLCTLLPRHRLPSGKNHRLDSCSSSALSPLNGPHGFQETENQACQCPKEKTTHKQP
jgi:hypothetical protein